MKYLMIVFVFIVFTSKSYACQSCKNLTPIDLKHILKFDLICEGRFLNSGNNSSFHVIKGYKNCSDSDTITFINPTPGYYDFHIDTNKSVIIFAHKFFRFTKPRQNQADSLAYVTHKCWKNMYSDHLDYLSLKKYLDEFVENRNSYHTFHFHKTAQIDAIGKLKDGVPEGFWYFFNENGDTCSYGNFVNGKKDGKWIGYDNIDHIKFARKNINVYSMDSLVSIKNSLHYKSKDTIEYTQYSKQKNCIIELETPYEIIKEIYNEKGVLYYRRLKQYKFLGPIIEWYDEKGELQILKSDEWYFCDNNDKCYHNLLKAKEKCDSILNSCFGANFVDNRIKFDFSDNFVNFNSLSKVARIFLGNVEEYDASFFSNNLRRLKYEISKIKNLKNDNDNNSIEIIFNFDSTFSNFYKQNTISITKIKHRLKDPNRFNYEFEDVRGIVLEFDNVSEFESKNAILKWIASPTGSVDDNFPKGRFIWIVLYQLDQAYFDEKIIYIDAITGEIFNSIEEIKVWEY